VQVETVLDSAIGSITDLSETGAKVMGKPFPVGQKVKITAADKAVWAQVRWAEQDRMGVQFETPMPDELRQLLIQRTPANDAARYGNRPVFGRKAV
jgi:hypothetical protein